MQKPRRFYHSPIYIDRHRQRMEEMSQWRSGKPRNAYGWWRIWNLVCLVLLLFLIFIVWKLLL